MYDSYYRLPQIECQSNQLNLVVFFKKTSEIYVTVTLNQIRSERK